MGTVAPDWCFGNHAHTRLYDGGPLSSVMCRALLPGSAKMSKDMSALQVACPKPFQPARNL